MTRKAKRLSSIVAILVVIGAAAGLVLTALSDSVAFFNSPSDIVANAPAPTQRIRLGGLVEEGSVVRDGTKHVTFRVTDTLESVPVAYTGLLPDLFREGQGVVTEGTLGPDRVFMADTVLAKHDENYMPKEVVDDLKARGLWEDGKGMVNPDATPIATNAGAGS
ncbi:MAG: cytochrome c maturation protein CcmE [Aurantimonas endophytica]|jgi:cytochrome c-type biogenesis protein CcmE|uniref:Cytochrome c-type biogenesis protein CcmE n=1 Tax=Aurantimonas endophytica TaxID=1522175 RepID=A0A7W6HFD6_9HYPH|nr:cytochrome c maturation protein CcmE [Aurantimonas endophytica]MBB4004225.1 cytochrome c-type biogenesis protein CcmE [Aurantimonas endophytica]MCO6405066.1 cytochrome c maturation protein CcmE [Aurantimonas endophytica]